jgi:hypothetical protein
LKTHDTFTPEGVTGPADHVSPTSVVFNRGVV